MEDHDRPGTPLPGLEETGIEDSGVEDILFGNTVLTGTPALDALFAAFEHAGPLGDPLGLGLVGAGLLGANLAPFG